jgi:hypothetical protein
MKSGFHFVVEGPDAFLDGKKMNIMKILDDQKDFSILLSTAKIKQNKVSCPGDEFIHILYFNNRQYSEKGCIHSKRFFDLYLAYKGLGS